jgi:hypothetical protein
MSSPELFQIASSDGSLALNQKSSRAAQDSEERELGRDLFIRKARNIRTLTRMLDRDAKDIAALIEIQNSVLIKILRFGYFGWLELDIERVSVLKVFDVHGIPASNSGVLNSCLVQFQVECLTRSLPLPVL